MQNLLVWGNRPIAFASPQISPKQNHLSDAAHSVIVPRRRWSAVVCAALACLLAKFSLAFKTKLTTVRTSTSHVMHRHHNL